MLIVINNKQSIAYVKGKAVEPYDVLCSDCGQLRLSFVESDKCGNCHSTNIVKGKIGTLERSQGNAKDTGKQDGQG